MSRNVLHRTFFGKCMGKAITPVVFLLGVATTSHATGLEGEPAGSNSRNGAEFTFTINQETCAVTINSNKRIRRFAFKNEAGRTIKALSVGQQNHLTGFVAELTAHPGGQISIRSGDRIWTRLDANVNLAFAECIALQPAVLAQAYSDLDGNGSYDPIYDELIARLTDDNGDGVASPGDVLELGSTPTSFSRPEEDRYNHNSIVPITSALIYPTDSDTPTYTAVVFGGLQHETSFNRSSVIFSVSPPPSQSFLNMYFNDTAGSNIEVIIHITPTWEKYASLYIWNSGPEASVRDTVYDDTNIETAFRMEIFDPVN